MISSKDQKIIDENIKRFEQKNTALNLNKRDKKLLLYFDLMAHLINDLLEGQNFEGYKDLFEITFEPIEREVIVAKSIFGKSRRTFLLDE